MFYSGLKDAFGAIYSGGDHIWYMSEWEATGKLWV